MTDKPNILLVTALPAETRPLTEHFRLKAVSNTFFRQWHNDTIVLVQTGIGRVNAAAATASVLSTLLSSPQDLMPACLNIGIAGGDDPIGHLSLAHAIKDSSSGKTWYPQLQFAPNTPTREIHTVDSPCTDYRPGILYDMESSGYLGAATRFSSLELIQCLKIVSDNGANPVSAVTKAHINSLIGDHLDTIGELVNQLIELASMQPDNRELERHLASLFNKVHCTENHRHALRQALYRYHAVTGRLPSDKDYSACHSPADFTAVLDSATRLS